MQIPKSSKEYKVTLEFKNSVTRTVSTRATSLEVAERRALKRNPAAIGIKQGAVNEYGS